MKIIIEHPLTKTFLNVMQYGLGRTNSIYTYLHIEDIENFIEWQLNNYQINMEYIEAIDKTKNLVSSYKLTIMVSGGLDSEMAYYYAIKKYKYRPEDICIIHVKYGAPYGKAEQVKWNLFKEGKNYITIDLHQKRIEEDEMPYGYIIPFRNALFGAIGSLISNTIWIAANYRLEQYREGKDFIDLKDMGVSDKSITFFNRLSEILSVYQNKPIRVWSPFQHLSKADCIKWAKVNLSSKEFTNLVRDTITCYNPIIKEENIKNCGRCFTCWKLYKMYKKTKVINNWNFLFDQNPETDHNIETYKQREINKGR